MCLMFSFYSKDVNSKVPKTVFVIAKVFSVMQAIAEIKASQIEKMPAYVRTSVTESKNKELTLIM